MKKKTKIIIIFILLVLFITLIYCIKNDLLINIDSSLYNIIFSINSKLITNINKIFTHLGSVVCFLTIIIMSFIFIKNKKISTYLLTNLILIFSINKIIQYLVCRIRPTEINIINVNGYGFPSAHTAISISFYGFIIYLINKSNIKYKKLIYTLVSLIIIIIPITRIYLGAHYPSDIIGGIIEAIIFLIIFTSIYERNNKNGKRY